MTDIVANDQWHPMEAETTFGVEAKDNKEVFKRLPSVGTETNNITTEGFPCCYHPECGGWCETEDQQAEKMCADCLQELDEAERAHELAVAIQRIAVAAGIELASPSEVADVVCAKLYSAKELKNSVARWLAVSEWMP